jgi:hypothetical protein
MNIFQNIDLNNIAPIIGLAAIAVLIIAALLLRAVLHSRIALVIAVVIGVALAGPALGGALASIISSLVVMAIVIAVAVLGALLIIRSHPDLRDLAREAISLLPRRSTLAAPSPIKGEGRGEGSITVIDQPAPVTRHVTRHNSGSDWGF